jgi:hypothetical protein
MAKTTAPKMRVAIPKNSKDILLLAEKIYQKHIADGANSVLGLLNDHSWAIEGPKISIALDNHNLAEIKSKNSEKAYKERDLTTDNLIAIIKASRDLLTGLNRNNMKRLGDWGFEVNDTPLANAKRVSTKMRVVIPVNLVDMLALADKIYQKHLNDGANSPLLKLQSYDWAVAGPTIAPTLANHTEAVTLKVEAEQYYAERDLVIPSITAIIKASRDTLTGVYRQNMKNLHSWGFEVDAATRRKK